MVDISLCANSVCPLRQKCYRFRAIPSEVWQAYSMFKPYKLPDGTFDCDYFWDMTGQEKEYKNKIKHDTNGSENNS